MVFFLQKLQVLPFAGHLSALIICPLLPQPYHVTALSNVSLLKRVLPSSVLAFATHKSFDTSLSRTDKFLNVISSANMIDKNLSKSDVFQK